MPSSETAIDPLASLSSIARHAEQHQAADACDDGVGRGPAQRVTGVLHDTGHEI